MRPAVVEHRKNTQTKPHDYFKLANNFSNAPTCSINQQSWYIWANV